MEFVRSIFQILFEDTTITTNTLKSCISSPSIIEIHTLFAIFNNKELRNFKGRPTHSILKGMESLFRYKCNEVGYAELSFQKKGLF